MTAGGQSRHFGHAAAPSGVPRSTDILGVRWHVSNVPTRSPCTAANWQWLAGEIGVVDYLWLVRGNTILNWVKSPGSVSTSMLPPCCFTIMSWLMDRPSPVPSPEGLVAKNGLNIFSFTSSGCRFRYREYGFQPRLQGSWPRPPLASRAVNSDMPPICRSPQKTCGSVAQPLARRIISSRRSQLAAMSISRYTMPWRFKSARAALQ